MSGFREPEMSREQMMLWSRRLTLRGSGQVCTAVNLGILLKHWEVVKAMG